MRKLFISLLFIGSIAMVSSHEHKSSLLVDGEYLSQNSSKYLILDTGRKIEDYKRGHIPNAVYADRAEYYGEVNGISGMFTGVEVVSKWLGEIGVDVNTPIVIYDAGNGLWASRLAWTLEYLGHDNWKVLNGGYNLWNVDGYAISTKDAVVKAKTFVADVRPELLATSNEIKNNLQNPNYQVIDTRSQAEYVGSDVRSERGGHVPGAFAIEWTKNNSDTSYPSLLGKEELGEFYQNEGVDPNSRVVSYCQTAVRGAHTWFALKIAGYENVALYDGSWAEWGNSDSLPITTGEAR